MDENEKKQRMIQEFVPGKQVTLAHVIAHPVQEIYEKMGLPERGAIGILTLTPGETAIIAADIATKAADVNTVSKLPKINGKNYPLASFDSFSYRLTS